MANFNETRQQLDDLRNAQSSAHKNFLESREHLKKITKQRKAVEAKVNDNSDDHVNELNRLVQEEKRASEIFERRKIALSGSKDATAQIYHSFETLSDPRQQIGQLKDSFPFLLFPVRIETRFKKQIIRDTEVHQLWIRLYPDDCLIDSFEEMPSETEIKNLTYYWSKIWEAGGDENMERGAWRTLVGSHGSGRSLYFLEQYKPLNPTEIPTKANVEDMVLVIAHHQTLSPSEKSALKKYWEKVWHVMGDATKEAEAWNDLVTDAGGESAAQALVDQHKPFNLDIIPAPPKSKFDVNITLHFLQLPDPATLITKEQSWSQAPYVDMLPERFVVTGYINKAVAFEAIGNHIPSPLYVAPDPGVPEEEQFSKNEKGDVVFPEELQWMTDFDVAIQNGLGLKVNISADQAARGFDRIVVLGVRLSADEQKGKALVETLFDHHNKSRKGIALIPQGTPTNNTEDDAAGHESLDDADKSFELLKKGRLFQYESDWKERKDGQWLAESLGIGYDAINKIANADLSDQAEARMMKTALWPATMGYMMDTLMQQIFSDNDIRFTRDFFNLFVSGRGRIPAIKIGRQPYGILPTVAFSQLKWLNRDNDVRFLATNNNNNQYISNLYSILKIMDEDWKGIAEKVSFVGKKGDAHQILLDALGLTASSIEYYQRTAESKEDLFNRYNMVGLGSVFMGMIVSEWYVKGGQNLLKKLGYKKDEIPDILNKFFLRSQNQLKGPVIDDQPLSEKEAIRKYTTDDKNYLEWLIGAAEEGHDTLRRQEGFKDNKIPNALLYLLLHHSLDLGYVEVSLQLHRKAGLFTDDQVRKFRVDPLFMHMETKNKTTESKWSHIYKKEPAITGNANILISKYIADNLKTEVASQYLLEQLECLKKLKDLPTARLERLFAEHIDCCTYRLDAWKAGITNYQLSLMRRNLTDNQGEFRQGLHIGAFGWVENVKSENKQLTPVEINDKELKEYFVDGEEIPLQRDSTNGGYLLAPSLNHAITASILRNGYTANNDPNALRINLSSERVRKALSVIEGIRGGQSLGALLGYQLERGLHEGYPGVELDFLIYQLRKAFPLVVNKLKETKVEDTDGSLEVIEARNVIDGLLLINDTTKSGQLTYPFGKTVLPQPISTAQADAINKEVDKIRDINDAVADLALAESVHQVVQGNYDRANATLDAFSKGNFPPEPEVIQTPRSGSTLTHRVGLHLKTGLPLVAADPPRAKAEPAINEWLGTRLPALNKIICYASYDAVIDEPINATDLLLSPIDLLYSINTDSEQALTEIDDRVLKFVLDKPGVRPDTEVKINYMKRVNGTFSFFEIAPLLNSLRSILLRSRHLTPNDVTIAADAKTEESQSIFADNNLARLQAVHGDITTLRNTSLANYIAALQPLMSDTATNRNAILNGLDTVSIQPLISLLFQLNKTGLPQSGFGFIYQRKKELYKTMLSKVSSLVKRWDDKLALFNSAMIEYNNLPAATTDAEKIVFLQNTELYISTVIRTVLPAIPADYVTLLNAQRAAFENKRNEFDSIKNTTVTSLKDLFDTIQVKLPIDAFDAEPFDMKSIEDQLLFFAEELYSKAVLLATDLDKRLTSAGKLITDASMLTDNNKKVNSALEVAKLLLHQDFKIIPEFLVAPSIANEWNNSFQNKTQLLSHLTSEGVDFPEDDWLYGVARVREKLHHWENIVLLSQAYQQAAPELHPVQLPYMANDSWLALEYPETYKIERDRLLYTAHYSAGFDHTILQCGLLIDEWTETVPSKEETVGLSFHYDRPNAEPPQVMLLAMPTEFTGEWKWQDLLNTVNETLDMAKKRAVEPAHIDSTDYARFLPAVISSMTIHPITASLNFAFNNKIHEILNG